MLKYLIDESGATAIEYTIMMTLMALALLTAMPILTDGVLGNANKIANILK
jgi:Flp pilus assembly pilin Flp